MNLWHELVTSAHMNQWHHRWVTSWISDIMNQWPQYTQCPDVHDIGPCSDPHVAWTLQWPESWYPDACAEVKLKYQGHIKCFEGYETVWTKSLLPDGPEQKKDAAFLHWLSCCCFVCVCVDWNWLQKYSVFGHDILLLLFGELVVFFCCCFFIGGEGGGVATAQTNKKKERKRKGKK